MTHYGVPTPCRFIPGGIQPYSNGLIAGSAGV